MLTCNQLSGKFEDLSIILFVYKTVNIKIRNQFCAIDYDNLKQ